MDSKKTPRGIRVRYSETVPEQHPAIYAYALKVEVLSAEGYDDHVFLFQRSKTNLEDDWVDEFIQIASPLDIEEVPEDAPDLKHNMPYFRTKEVTLWFRCLEDLRLAKGKIRDDLQTLALTYDTIGDRYDKDEEETYGSEE